MKFALRFGCCDVFVVILLTRSVVVKYYWTKPDFVREPLLRRRWIGSGALGCGKNVVLPRAPRWSAGRRRTPASLGCAPSQRRGGPRHGPPGCAAAHPAPPGAPSPSLARGRKKGKGAPGTLKTKYPGGVALAV